MSSPSDPIRTLRLRMLATWVVGIGALVPCAWWALADPSVERLALQSEDAPVENSTPQAIEPQQREFDLDSLVVQLWNPPPPPIEEQPSELVAEADPPPPLRLQLIGIIEENGVYQAALYDPDGDRIHIVSDGDVIGGLTVQSVTAALVIVSNGERTQALELITGREGPSA